MNKKRIFSILMAATLTFTGTTTTFAKALNNPQQKTAIINIATPDEEKSVKISKEKAQQIAKEAIKTYFKTEIDESKFTQRISLNVSNYNAKQNYMWNIYWEMNDREKNTNINVTLNANNGKITSMGNREYVIGEENTIPTISLKEAEKISDDFVKKIESDKFSQCVRKNNNRYGYTGSPNYNFNYVRKVNNIEFDGNSINIEVDGTKGKIVSYDCNWDESLIFPDAKAVIDTKTALETFKKESKMSLRYNSFINGFDYYQSKKDIKLIFMPEFSKGSLLDAKEGKMMDWYNNSNAPEVKDLNEKEKQEFSKKQKFIAPREKAIEQEEAEKLLNNLIKELYGEGYSINDLSYQEGMGGYGNQANKQWCAYFNKGEKDKYNEGGYVSIDALTGAILNCNRYSNEQFMGNEKFEPKLTWEQAYKKALDTVAKYYPDKVNKIKTEQYHYNFQEKDMQERSYYFNFQRIENGIEYLENSISVGFNAMTGNMDNMNLNWESDVKFPTIKDAISNKDAEEIFFEKYKPTLVYTLINKSDNYEKPIFEVKLAYRLSDSNGYYEYTTIDALTGKFVNYNGENMEQNIEGFKNEIKDSKAEKELSILAYKGLIDTNDFKLNKQITQIDLIKMLVNARGYRPYMMERSADLKFSNITKSDANYKYLQMAVSYGIMENSDTEFKAEQLVSREELAKTLVKFTNYSKLAECSDIFKINFKDENKISKGNLGYAAIAQALGFIRVENNEFKPSDKATMEELAIGVYNALNNVRNTQY